MAYLHNDKDQFQDAIELAYGKCLKTWRSAT